MTALAKEDYHIARRQILRGAHKGVERAVRLKIALIECDTHSGWQSKVLAQAVTRRSSLVVRNVAHQCRLGAAIQRLHLADERRRDGDGRIATAHHQAE